MQKKTLFAILVIWIGFSSFYWKSEEEKELGEIFQRAERAFEKRDFKNSKEAYEQLISKIGVNTTHKYKVDWLTYIDIVLNYADSCKATNEFTDGEQALSKLLSCSPPSDQLVRIKLKYSLLTLHKKSPKEAYLEMYDLLKNSSSHEWCKTDLSFFHALEYSLNDYYDRLMEKAGRLITTKNYAQALVIYEEILSAIQNHYYPKANLKDSILEKKLCFLLAKTLYYQELLEKKNDCNLIQLSANYYETKKSYLDSLKSFQKYTCLQHREDLDNYYNSLLEQGRFYYQAGNLNEATQYFQQLKKSKLKDVANIYLSKIYSTYDKNIYPLSEEFISKYQAMLDLAKTHFKQNSLEIASFLLEEIVNDFSSDAHPLTMSFKQREIYPSIFCEAEYLLCRLYLSTGRRQRALEQLESMLTHFDEANIESGHYLSLVWEELSKLARDEPDTSMLCLNLARKCRK